MKEKTQLVIFKLGNEEYGIDIEQIKEVVITPKIAKIPQTEKYIKGIANIRGVVTTIMDLEERFNLVYESKSNSNISNYTLVVEKFKIGILVKEIPNTLTVLSSNINNVSNISKYSIDGECIVGIINLGDRMIIMIDIFELLSIDKNIKNI